MSIYFTGKTMLTLDLLGCVISVSVLLLTAALTPPLQTPSAYLLWGCTGVLGLSFASIYATVYSIPMQQYGWEIDSYLATMLTVGGCTGDMLVPMIIGWVMSGLGTHALLPSMLIMFLPATVLFVLVTWTFPYFWKIGTNSPEKTVENSNLQDLSIEK